MQPKGDDMVRIETTINGRPRSLEFGPEVTVLELLRDDLGLVGTRGACGVGVCGSCTVLLDGRPVSSCLLLAANIEGRELLTIEGVGQGDRLDPVQEAFLRHQAFQCGFCTPGMILAVKALLAENRSPTREEICEYLAGNVCRCGTYAEVLRAVHSLVEADG